MRCVSRLEVYLARTENVKTLIAVCGLPFVLIRFFADTEQILATSVPLNVTWGIVPILIPAICEVRMAWTL